MLLRAVLVITVASAASGCAAATCFGSKSDESYDNCVADVKAEREADRRHAREEARRRDEYLAARPQCHDHDALACFTVGTYGAGHDGDPNEITPAFAAACDGSIAAACVGGGEYAKGRGDTAAAVASYRRGCELRDARGCAGAAALDPANAMELETAACELKDYAACYRVGEGHLAAHRRDEAVTFLTLACRNGEDDACQQLGRIDIEDKP